MSWDSLTAAQQDALLRRPFDHFARYRLAADVVTATVGPRARILDLGGGPGSLQAFLPEADVVSSDIVVPGDWHATAPDLVVADGAALPFADDAFDAVVSLDTLEHVPPASRTSFLDEVARVAGRWALVVCPYATPGVADADTALRAYVANRFAPDLPTIAILDEHLGYGHPDLDASRTRLGIHGPTGVVPSGRIDRWFAGMVAFFHLLALGDDEPVEVVQRFLNRGLYEADLVEPAYRHGILLRTGPEGPDPADVAADLTARAAAAPWADADLSLLQAVLGEALVASAQQAQDARRTAEAQREAATAQLAMTEEARRQAHTHAEGLEQARAADADRLGALEAELAELRGFRDRVVAHPAMRARAFVRRLLDRGPK